MTALEMPPEVVPRGLDEREYAKLMFRYLHVPRYRQYLVAQKFSLESSTESGAMSEEQRKTVTTLLGVLTGAMQAQEIVNSAQDWALARLLDTASLASNKLDEFEKVRQPKQMLTGILSSLSRQAVAGLDHVVENLLLPALGLPLKGLPTAKTSEEYYSAGRKYLLAGLFNSADACFHKSVDLDAGAQAGIQSAIALRTRIPTRKMSLVAEKKLMRVKELLLIKNLDAAIAASREGMNDFPEDFAFPVNLAALIIYEGSLDEADYLIKNALRLFPDSEEAMLVRVRIDIIALQLQQARRYTERLLTLDPDNKTANSNLNLVTMLDSLG